MTGSDGILHLSVAMLAFFVALYLEPQMGALSLWVLTLTLLANVGLGIAALASVVR